MTNDFSAEAEKGARWKTGRLDDSEGSSVPGGGASNGARPPLSPDMVAALNEVSAKVRAIEASMRALGLDELEFYSEHGRIYVKTERTGKRRLYCEGRAVDEWPAQTRLLFADPIDQIHEDFIEAGFIWPLT